MPASSLKGNNTGSVAAPTDLTVSQVKTLLAIASTDVSGLGSLATKSTIGTADITDGVVSNTDLTTMAANTVKMNNTGSTAAPQDVTVASLKTALAVPALPIAVTDGGSGRTTATTAYGLIAAGTTATGPEQTVAPAASGFLKTTSTTALPAWTAIAQADVTNLVNDLSNKQPLDSDLSAIAALAQANGSMIQSNGSAWIAATPTQVKSALAITKTDVGLANVDNTSDANKLISTATQTALDGKQPIDTDLTAIAALTPGVNAILQSNGAIWTAATPATIKTSLSLVKGDVGLGSVDNTSDANKPVSTAQNTADLLRVLKAGDTMTGSLIVSGPSWDHVMLRGATQADLRLQSTAPVDWALITATASNLNLQTFPTSSTISFAPNGTSALSLSKTQVQANLPVMLLGGAPTDIAHATRKDYVDAQDALRQPLDTDLTTIAGLTATTDNIIQSVGSAWASRTPAQVKTALALDQVNNTSDVNKPVSTAQATADGLRVLKAGDIMTGPLNLHGTTLVVKDVPGTHHVRHALG